jgi:hypothetical protein
VPTISGPTSNVGTASTLGSGSPIHTVKVASISGGLTAGTPVTINFTAGFTNPSTATSFYARILTYNGGAANYTPANTTGGATTPGTYHDYGGVALSTAANINITSKVFETLSYCVFQSACGTPPALTLGDPTTGALGISTAYVNSNAQYTIATNAGGGAAVVMRGNTLCRSSTLSNCNTGAASQFTITSIGGTAATSSVGNEQFGLCVNTVGATGGLAAQSPYDDPGTGNSCNTGIATGAYSGSSKFALDDSTGGNGSNGTSGTLLMQSTGAISSFTGTFAFLGNIAATTEAGIYTTSLNTVATGKF